MADQVVETLLVQEGNNYQETGQAIASWSRSIVFLPAGAIPGQKVRVILREIPGKTDRRGRPLYQADPAEVEYTERWKDNGDGTASRVKIATDWLMVESEVEALETRPLATREGVASTREDRKVIWGTDLMASVVEVVKVKIVPFETEQVRGGGLVWVKTGEREEAGGFTNQPVVEVKITGDSWWTHRLLFNWETVWSVTGQVYYLSQNIPGQKSSFDLTTTLAEMPGWWQTEQKAQYPVCSCGRQRRKVQVDGYGKCEKCRAEETCDRCGKQITVAVLNGRLICAACQPYESAEAEITTELPMALRQTIAAEAKRLLAGQALSREEGEVILRATANHIADSWQRNQLLQKWAGYGWYYFCEEGVYAAKLAPAALQVLQYLSQATGNGLIELVAWIAQGPRVPANIPDYYVVTQVIGERFAIGDFEDRTEKSLESLIGKLSIELLDKKSVLADWLRGSEPDRQAALAGLAQLAAIEKHSSNLQSVLQEAQALMHADAQNYRATLIKIAEAEQIAVGLERLRTLLQTEYGNCPACGQPWENGARDGAECGCLAYDEAIQPPFSIKRSCVTDGSFGLLVSVECAEYDGYPIVALRVHDSNIPELSKVKTEVLWTPPSEEEQGLWQRMRELESRLGIFDREIKQCEGDYPSRVLLTFELDSQRGTLFALANVREFLVLDNKTQESVPVSGTVRFVCDSGRCHWLDSPPAAGESWVSSRGKMIGRDKKGRPIVIANPQVRVDDKARKAIEVEIRKIETEIGQLRATATGSSVSVQTDETPNETPSAASWEQLAAQWGATIRQQ